MNPVLNFLIGPLRQDLSNNSSQLFPGSTPHLHGELRSAGTVRHPHQGVGHVRSAIMLAMPVILWQLWRFIAPGLYSQREEVRHQSFVAIGSGPVLHAGAAIAFWTVPKALEFLSTIGRQQLRTSPSCMPPDKYLRLIIYMMIAFGIGFEFPIVLVFMQLVGVRRPTKKLRQASAATPIVIVAVVVAVATTPSADPISMLRPHASPCGCSTSSRSSSVGSVACGAVPVKAGGK